MRPKWFPDWRAYPVIIVASGPSAAATPLSVAKGRAKFIAVNDSWRLCPWADILFAGDYQWWAINDGCPKFAGLRVSIDRRAGETREWNVHRVQGHRSDQRLNFDLGHLAGSNSGFNALNLAVQLGATTILLVGFDMTLDAGIHWHGPHRQSMKNPDPQRVARWRKSFDLAAHHLAERHIRVINCSVVSLLKRYQKMDFERAVEEFCPAPVC